MSNPTDTNQASEDELREKINSALFADDFPILNDIEKDAVERILAIIRTEKLKLLDKVRERVVGEKTSPNFDNEYGYCDNCEFQPTDGTKHCLCYYDEKLRKKQRNILTKLEAEVREQAIPSPTSPAGQ